MSIDPSSYSNVEDIVLKNVDLNVEVLFNKQILCGHVDLTFHNINKTKIIVLDTKLLTIHKIIKLKLDFEMLDIKTDREEESAEKLDFILGEHHDAFGSALTIDISKYCNKSFLKVRIY